MRRTARGRSRTSRPEDRGRSAGCTAGACSDPRGPGASRRSRRARRPLPSLGSSSVHVTRVSSPGNGPAAVDYCAYPDHDSALSAPDQVAGVVLAAGLSTRMGRNKLLLEVGGEPVVARAVHSARDAGLEPVLVVVGHEAERVRAAIADVQVTTVTNPDPEHGIHTSVRVGVQALAARPDAPGAAVVMLADMPLVSSAMVRRLVDGWRAARPQPPLVISLYGDVVAPPILYGAPLFAELGSLDGDGCGKRVVKRHRAEALEVHWPPWALADLDEPADVVRVERLLGRALELS